MKQKLSVIIVSYRGAGRLERCLESLISAGHAETGTEIIVVNNSPGDSGIEDLKQKFSGVRFSDSDINGGFGYGCNAGAAMAEGEWLLFLNPDTVVEGDSLKRLLTEAGREDEGMIYSCRQMRSDGKESRAWGEFPRPGNLTGFQRSLRAIFSGRRSNLIPEGSNVFYPDWVSGSVILIRKEDFTGIGGFDDEFWMYYEDVDLCFRAASAGGRIVFFRDVIIDHHHGGSSRIDTVTTAITKTEVMISRHLYVSKHFQGGQRAVAQLYMIVANILSGLIPALAGLLFPFVRRLFARTLVYGRLLRYYGDACLHGTWISRRSARYSLTAGQV